MEEYIWRILHKPTGLFYCSKKGRWKHTRTNLSEKGNFYLSEKTTQKVLLEDCKRAEINNAQVKKYNLKIIKSYWSCSEAIKEDFEIVKYRLEKVISCA